MDMESSEDASQRTMPPTPQPSSEYDWVEDVNSTRMVCESIFDKAFTVVVHDREHFIFQIRIDSVFLSSEEHPGDKPYVTLEVFSEPQEPIKKINIHNHATRIHPSFVTQLEKRIFSQDNLKETTLNIFTSQAVENISSSLSVMAGLGDQVSRSPLALDPTGGSRTRRPESMRAQYLEKRSRSIQRRASEQKVQQIERQRKKDASFQNVASTSSSLVRHHGHDEAPPDSETPLFMRLTAVMGLTDLQSPHKLPPQAQMILSMLDPNNSGGATRELVEKVFTRDPAKDRIRDLITLHATYKALGGFSVFTGEENSHSATVMRQYRIITRSFLEAGLLSADVVRMPPTDIAKELQSSLGFMGGATSPSEPMIPMEDGVVFDLSQRNPRPQAILEFLELPPPPSYGHAVSSADSRFLREYEIMSILGRGGWGEVLKVRSLVDNHLYALKKVRVSTADTDNEWDTGALTFEEIQREVLALAKVKSQFVVRYFTAWIENATSEEHAVRTLHDSSVSDSRESDSDGGSSVASGTNNFPEVAEEEDDAEESSYSYSGTGSYSYSEASPCAWDDISGSYNPLPRAEFEPTQTELSDSVSSTDEPEKPATLFILMELCTNGTLKHALELLEFKTDTTLWKISYQIAAGLADIHAAGITHRDLKPDNIFFDDEMNVLIGDFGFAFMKKKDDSSAAAPPNDPASTWIVQKDTLQATVFEDPGERIPATAKQQFPIARLTNSEPNTPKQKHEEEIRAASFLGTGLYMAPEIGSREGYTNSVDMYAYGIILFELWHPFSSLDERESLMQNVRDGELPREWAVHHPIQATLISSLIDAEPSNRPSAKKLVQEFFPTIPELSVLNSPNKHIGTERRATAAMSNAASSPMSTKRQLVPGLTSQNLIISLMREAGLDVWSSSGAWRRNQRATDESLAATFFRPTTKPRQRSFFDDDFHFASPELGSLIQALVLKSFRPITLSPVMRPEDSGAMNEERDVPLLLSDGTGIILPTKPLSRILQMNPRELPPKFFSLSHSLLGPRIAVCTVGGTVRAHLPFLAATALRTALNGPGHKDEVLVVGSFSVTAAVMSSLKQGAAREVWKAMRKLSARYAAHEKPLVQKRRLSEKVQKLAQSLKKKTGIEESFLSKFLKLSIPLSQREFVSGTKPFTTRTAELLNFPRDVRLAGFEYKPHSALFSLVPCGRASELALSQTELLEMSLQKGTPDAPRLWFQYITSSQSKICNVLVDGMSCAFTEGEPLHGALINLGASSYDCEKQAPSEVFVDSLFSSAELRTSSALSLVKDLNENGISASPFVTGVGAATAAVLVRITGIELQYREKGKIIRDAFAAGDARERQYESKFRKGSVAIIELVAEVVQPSSKHITARNFDSLLSILHQIMRG
eukprot:gnl/Chilomastix_cuspidata/1432.p1 GENE.gnl/Chilomastix_cuspidata/1432~~gnl/Chilomastix_cuspidata/1432.p1  ORF type:complete len:1385 (+),score=505.28 gnl/Chilomastix_cuspidata/1432:658-4812(+)